jgi:hypothetical protein
MRPLKLAKVSFSIAGITSKDTDGSEAEAKAEAAPPLEAVPPPPSPQSYTEN